MTLADVPVSEAQIPRTTSNIATNYQPFRVIRNIDSDNLTQLSRGIHQWRVRAEEDAVGAGFVYQLFNEARCATFRTGFEVDVWGGAAIASTRASGTLPECPASAFPVLSPGWKIRNKQETSIPA